ncbi:MAG: excinuclease ABC subunit UvrA, partial [Desulfobacterales bacterium]
YDYLRLLFARVGTAHCYRCGDPISPQSIDQIVDRIMTLPSGHRIIILAPLVDAEKGAHEKLLKRLRKDGFARVRVDGEILEIEAIDVLDKRRSHSIDVVVDRLVVTEKIHNRLADSLELALALSDGKVTVDMLDRGTIRFSEKATCLRCGIDYSEFTPASFSFNSPRGACPRCDGLGTTTEFDPDLIVPNPELSLREGAVAIWANRSTMQFIEFLDALTAHYGASIYTPYKDLPKQFKHVLMQGSGKDLIPFYFERGERRYTYKKTFEGIIPKLKRRYTETDSFQVREEIKLFMNFRPCSECGGAKLNRESRSVKVGGLAIHEISAMSIAQAQTFQSGLKLEGQQAVIAERILKEIDERLGFLNNVGLSYLTLDRPAATLSGGESQRIRLATQIGSKLTGVLYVLDEPSIGLHQRDNRRLLQTLMQMRDLGNTVLVVEHDEETIRTADYVVDMGPGAGINGGHLVFAGTPDRLIEEETSLTGQYLSGRKRIEVPRQRRFGNGREIVIEGASANNLKHIDVSFPLGIFTCVTGVSGSGKSTLVLETLHHLLSQRIYRARIPAGAHRAIKGLEHIDKVVNIDQSPIGKTPRSNPGTYTGVFNHIRDLFARTPEARVRGYKPGRFSFNVKGGRCEACGGDGIVKIEMHFLPDVYVTCDVCRGRRYNRETLEIRYKGKNIAEVL